MTKRNKFYQIGFIVSTIVCIGLMLAVGIIAVQKSMKLNMSFQMNPSIYVKVEIYNTSTSKYETIFQNTNATEIKSGVILSGNTLQFANDYATTLGTSLKMKVTSLNEGMTMLTEFSGASVTSGGNTITATATTYNVASDELTINTLSNLTIQFSQAFMVDVSGVDTNSATISAGQNVYTINGTYYVKSTATNAQFTLTSKEHYETPPTISSITGATYEFTNNNTLTLTKINGNVSITASASAMEYTITFNANGGTGGSSKSVDYGTTYSLPTEPTYDGYEFQGWSTTAGGSATWTSGTQKCTGVTTWYAVWKALEPFTFYTYEGSSYTAPTSSDGTAYKYYCEFGTYPQSYVGTDASVVSGLTPTSVTYAYNNAVTFYADSNGVNKYALVGSNYYEFEPIRWVVLGVDTSGDITFSGSGTSVTVASTTATLFTTSTSNLTLEDNRIKHNGTVANKLLFLSELALDNEYFDQDSSYINQWSSDDCDVRLFLNTITNDMTNFASISGLGDYYEGNDSSSERKYIQQTTLSQTSRYNVYLNTSETTDDSTCNMFLLGSNRNYGKKSSSETSNSTYYDIADSYNIASYFPIYTGTAVTALKGNVTPYAVANGAYTDGGSATDNTTLGASYWWLRSGYYSYDLSAYYVTYVGGVRYDYVYSSDLAVRPSFILNLA